MASRHSIIVQQYDEAVAQTLADIAADGITLADFDDRLPECTDIADNALYAAASLAWIYLDEDDAALTADELGTAADVLAAVKRAMQIAELEDVA